MKLKTNDQTKLYGIDINGLSKSERQRVQEIGLFAWMDQYSPQKPLRPAAETIGPRCALGHKCAFAKKRKAAFTTTKSKYCSDLCRHRGRQKREANKADFEAQNPGMAGIGV